MVWLMDAWCERCLEDTDPGAPGAGNRENDMINASALLRPVLVYISRRHYHTGKCGLRTKTKASLWIARRLHPLCGNCR